MVCQLSDRQVERTIDSLCYEKIDDYEVRRFIHQSGGFCREHSLRVLEHGDPLVHAIIYSRLFERKVEALRSQEGRTPFRSRRINGKRLRKRERPRGADTNHCLICMAVRELENRVMPLISCFYTLDEAFRNAFDARGHLCVPHLESLFSPKEGKTPEKQLLDKSTRSIITAQIEKYEVLAKHLREIERKFDYRYCGEDQCEEEREAWKLAAALWTGK